MEYIDQKSLLNISYTNRLSKKEAKESIIGLIVLKITEDAKNGLTESEIINDEITRLISFMGTEEKLEVLNFFIKKGLQFYWTCNSWEEEKPYGVILRWDKNYLSK